MFQTIFNVIVTAVVGGLVFVATFFDGGTVGTAMFERTKWVGEYFAVGSSEQLTVDVNGDLTTSATITMNGITTTVVVDTTPTSATTTVCALQSPTAGTTTLVAATSDFTVSTSTAWRAVVARSSTAFATTTSLGLIDAAANALGTLVASTSPTGGSKDLVFGPGQWLVTSMQGGIGSFSPSGTCSATFRSVN